MNGSYFSNPTFPSENNIDEKTDKNILSDNIGNIVSIYTKFDKEFNGRLESLNDNYILINDINNKIYYLINNQNINYISSNEELKI